MRGISVSKFGGINELLLKSSIVVPKTSDNEVLIKIFASGINPVDTYIRSGISIKLPSLPYTPGKDGAGLVHEVGKFVTKFKQGDRVFCVGNGKHGTLAEFSLVNERNVFNLDDKLTFDDGAALGIPYFTAYRALFILAKAKRGNSVLVHGASGAVGLAAVQIAKAYGMKVIGTAGTAAGIELVSKNGADSVYNHREADYVSKMSIKHGQFDIILEMLANVNLQMDMSLMNSHGITVIIGCRGEIKINPRLLMKPESSIIGCSSMSATPEEWLKTADEIMKGVKEGWVKPTISKIYSLEDVSQAHHDVIENQGTYGKLIVRVNKT